MDANLLTVVKYCSTTIWSPSAISGGACGATGDAAEPVALPPAPAEDYGSDWSKEFNISRVQAHLSKGLDGLNILPQPITGWDIKPDSEVSVQDWLRKILTHCATVLPQPICEEVSRKTQNLPLLSFLLIIDVDYMIVLWFVCKTNMTVKKLQFFSFCAHALIRREVSGLYIRPTWGGHAGECW